MIDIEKNWVKIREELFPTQRAGMNELVVYLENKTDFRTTPASSKFHLNVDGGLAQHSLNVLKYARLINKELALAIPEESIVITSLLHDVCKINYYVKAQVLDKEWKDKTGQWRKIDGYKVEDQLPLGHGEKSVIIINRFIPLKTDEMLAIRWHMAWSDPGTHFFYPSGESFRQSLNKHPLVKLLALADQMAELYESVAKERKE